MNIYSKPIKSAGLYIDKVLDRFVVYNPLSERGILVVGSGIGHLLEYCQGSQNVLSIAKRMSLSNKDTFEIMKKLADYEILNLPGYKPSYSLPNKESRLRVWIHTTNACNLACRYCYVNKDGRKMSVEIARKSVDALYQSIFKHKDVTRLMYVLAGGEPLTNLDAIKEILDYSQIQVQKFGISRTVAIITNGTILNSEIIALVKSHNIGLSISIDGLDDTNRNRVFRNGRSSVNVVLGHIDELLKAGIQPFILITLAPENLNGLGVLTKYLLERNLGFSFSLVRDPRIAVNLKTYLDRLIGILTQCYDLIEEMLPKCSHYIKHKFGTISLQSHSRRGCSLGKGSFVISHDGRVYLCQMDVGSYRKVTTIEDEDILGKVRTQMIYPELNEYKSIEEYQGCSQCYWRYQCAGGCPLFTKKVTGHLNFPSPYCAVYRKIIPRLIRLEALNFIIEHERCKSRQKSG